MDTKDPFWKLSIVQAYSEKPNNNKNQPNKTEPFVCISCDVSAAFWPL